MEASAVPMDCDVEKEMEEDEDLEFFQKSIKVHDRFGGNCEEEDEFYSDDDEPDEPTSCQKGGYLKPVGGFSRNVLTSETKLETISMLDNARSSCSKSGHDLSLEMLNLKSDDVGLGDLDGRAFLGKSILGSSPPFGDPLSEMDILDSALSLLDDKTCEKFREKGLFDGLVDKNGRIIDSEMMANENYICDVEAKLDMVSSEDKLTLEPFHSIYDSPKNLGRPTYDFTREDVSKPDVHPSTMAEPLGPLLSSQLKKTRQSKSVNSSRKQLNDSDSMDSKGSVGREYPPNNLSLDDLVRYINGESLKKVCNRKTSTPSSSSTLPPQTNAANTKKMKKQPVNKHDVATTTSKGKVPPAASRVRKTTKKASHVGTEEFTKDSPQEAFFDVDNTTAGSTTTTLVTASAKGTASTCNAEHDDENAGQEEFIAVLHKRRVKTRKEPVISRDMHPACVVSPQTKVAGQRQPEKTSSARVDRDLGASSMSVFSVSSKSYRSDTSGGSLTSKRGSLSSLDESPPLATYDTSALGASARDEDHAGAPPYYRPSFSKFSAGSSYASALLQNMPKFSVTGSRDVSQTEPRTVVASARFSSPLNSEAENEMLLSPPQSEADTGFSSSSSLSPDDAHVSLTSDSTLTTMSKGNEAVDSESRSHPLESRSHPLESRSHPLESRSHPLNEEDSSTLMQTSDGDVRSSDVDVRSDDFEHPVEECVVDDSVSRDISDLDFPLKTDISELYERTDKMHQHHHHHNAGESSLACSCRESSCAAATQSKNSPVIFDTRIRAVTRRMSNADIVFLFDADDSGADAMSGVVNYVAVDDIDGITFTSSPDSTPLETGAFEKASILSTVEASSGGTKTIVESYGFEVTDKLEVECQLEIQVTDDQARCDERVPLRDSEYGNAVGGNSRSVERRMSGVGKAAVRSAPRGSFDLLAAQKFFSQAFKSVLKREHECPGQVVRL